MSVTLSSELGLRLTNFCQVMSKEIVGRVIKVFRFEAHPRRKILMILGEVTITIVTPRTGLVESQITEDFKKPIHLLGLNRSAKSERVAREILSHCPLIDDTLLNKMTEAIEEIKQRDYDHNGIVINRQLAADGTSMPIHPEIFDEFDLAERSCLDGIAEEEPDFGKLDEYIELLYEDIPQKIEASLYLSKLAKSNSYLQDIAQHDCAVNAIFRTLREDSKKSSQLTKNILTISLAFAKTRDFQPVLLKHKIHILTLDIIDFELERCEKWKAQIMELEESALQKNNLSSRTLSEYHVMWTRLEELSTFQNSLLQIAFEVLHCLSENPEVRESLLEHRVITSLADALERRDNELLDVVISYLKTLSCFRQFVDEMVAVEVVHKLAKILKGGFPIPKRIVNQSLQLLYNLTFHSVLRENIVSCGLVNIISNCLAKCQFQEITCKIFYNLSMEPSVRSKMGKPSIIKPLMSHLTADEGDSIPKLFGSLAVNLSKNRKCAMQMWETNKLSQLIKIALKNEDFLAMKIIRNVAEQDAAFVIYEFIGDIAAAVVGSCDQEFVTECIGTLSFIDCNKVDVQILTQNGRIFPWLKQTLTFYLEKLQGEADDVTEDIKRISMDVMLLLGNICSTEEGTRIVIGEGFADILLKILHSVSSQDKEVLDLIFHIFTKSTNFESISIYFAVKTRIPSGLLEYAESCCVEKAKKSCIGILEQIGRHDDTWRENIQQFHFLSWNKDWTDAITHEDTALPDAIASNHEQLISQQQQHNTLNFQQEFGHSNQNPNTFRRIVYDGDETTDDEGEDDEEYDGNFERRGSGTNASLWSAGGNDGEYLDRSIIGLFKQQFEEEMALKKRMALSNTESFSDYLEGQSDFYDSADEMGEE